MKPMKIFLRYWFAITSVVSFAAGWAVLAHSNKPVAQTTSTSSSTVPMATLAPLNLNQNNNSNNNNGFGFFQPSTNSQSNPGFFMRTGGS